MRKRVSLDLIVNALLALTCVVVLGQYLETWWARTHAAASALPQSLPRGGQIPGLRDVVWTDRNVVVFVRSTCHFCSESMPFYRAMAGQAHAAGARFVVAGEESRDIIAGYMRSNAVTPDDVVSASPESTGVHATPTLAIVDRRGTILDSWVGRLTPDAEQRVKSLLAGP